MKFWPRPNDVKIEQLMGPQEYLSERRILSLHGDILPMDFSFPGKQGSSWYGAENIADTLLALDLESRNPIVLFIHSPGGWVDTGMILYDTIKLINSPVYTIGKSCQSMASILLASGEKGHRYILPNSRVMLHLPSGGIQGDEVDIKIQSKQITKVKEMLINVLIDNGVNKTKKQILKDIDREYWMDAQETIDYGIADKILTPEIWIEITNAAVN